MDRWAPTQQYEIEAILDDKLERGKRYWLCHWKGFDASTDTWEPTCMSVQDRACSVLFTDWMMDCVVFTANLANAKTLLYKYRRVWSNSLPLQQIVS